MKKVLSVALALLMCFLTFSTVGLTANAAVVTIDTISVGDTWHGSWTTQEESKVVRLNIEETGFYKFNITDNKQTLNCVMVAEIEDITAEESVLSTICVNFDGEGNYIIPISYTTESVYLAAGHQYEFRCGYVDVASEALVAGDVSVSFLKSDADDIYTIPNCSVTSSNLMLQFTDFDDKAWLKFTSSSVGDYSLNFSSYMSAFVSVYDAETGEELYEKDTEYLVTHTEEWYNRNKIVFNLEANKEYYILVDWYDDYITTTKLSMTKNAKTLKSVAANSCFYTVTPLWYAEEIDETCFNFKVTYTDNTTQIFDDYEALCIAGYDKPFVYYAGDTFDVDGKTYLDGGNQPISTLYAEKTTTSYIYIKTLVEYCAHLMPKGEDDICTINYEGSESQAYFWHIRVDETGYYGVWRYNSDDFDTNFLYYNWALIDENNNVLDIEDARFVLQAGKDYVLRFEYQYHPSYSWNDIEFWLEKDDSMTLRKGWVKLSGKWYFYENGVKVKNSWRKDSKGWVRLGEDGAMLTNKWCTDSKGWCYVGADGYAVTNCWKKDSYGWIWLDSEGSMTKNKWLKDGGKWYFLDSNGYMVTNSWRKDSKGWVRLGPDGAMLTNKWCTDSKGWCYVGADGYAVTNCWKKDSIGWIWLDKEGSMTKSQWLYNGGKWYYLDADGYMVTGRQTIGGKVYNFNSSGVWIS